MAPLGKEQISLLNYILNYLLAFIVRSKSFISLYTRLINIIRMKKTLSKARRAYYNWTSNRDGTISHGYEWDNSPVYNKSISFEREALEYYRLDEYTFINIISRNQRRGNISQGD